MIQNVTYRRVGNLEKKKNEQSMMIDLKFSFIKDNLNALFIHESHPIFAIKGADRKESGTAQTPYTTPIDFFFQRVLRRVEGLC